MSEEKKRLFVDERCAELVRDLESVSYQPSERGPLTDLQRFESDKAAYGIFLDYSVDQPRLP